MLVVLVGEQGSRFVPNTILKNYHVLQISLPGKNLDTPGYIYPLGETHHLMPIS